MADALQVQLRGRQEPPGGAPLRKPSTRAAVDAKKAGMLPCYPIAVLLLAGLGATHASDGAHARTCGDWPLPPAVPFFQDLRQTVWVSGSRGATLLPPIARTSTAASSRRFSGQTAMPWIVFGPPTWTRIKFCSFFLIFP